MNVGVITLNALTFMNNIIESITYDLPVNGYLVSVELSVLNTTWIPSKPVIMEYKIKVKEMSKPLKELLVLLKVNVNTIDYSDIAGTYVLAKIRDYSTYTGKIRIFMPSSMLYILSKISFIDIMPTLIVIAENRTYTFNLIPHRLIINNSLTKEVLIGNCSSSLDKRKPIELCIYSYYLRNTEVAKETISLIVSIKNQGDESLKSILTIVTGNLILSSKVINIDKGLEIYVPIPLQALLSIIKDDVTKLDVRILTLNMSKVVSTSLPIPLNIKFSKPVIALRDVPTLVFEGDSITFNIELRNPNILPLHVHNILLTVGNTSIRCSKFPNVVLPKDTVELSFRLKPNNSGSYTLKLSLNYSINTENSTMITELGSIKVIKALTITVTNKFIRRNEVMNIEVIAFKPLKNIVLIAERDNNTYRLTYVGSFPEPGNEVVNVPITLEPGNYTLYAMSITDNVISNGINITVLNENVSNNLKKSSKYSSKITNTVIKVLEVSNEVCAGCNVSIKLILNNNVSNVNIKLYRYEERFSPPWILQPLLNIKELGNNTYELIFKAPTKKGMYTYKIELAKGGNIIGSKNVYINVVSGKGLTVGKPLIPPELFYPIIATSALASLILFRRYSKRRE